MVVMQPVFTVEVLSNIYWAVLDNEPRTTTSSIPANTFHRRNSFSVRDFYESRVQMTSVTI
jgi:hypothetical protein